MNFTLWTNEALKNRLQELRSIGENPGDRTQEQLDAMMAELLGKFDEKMILVKFNAVTIQITSLLLKANKPLADRVAALADGMDLEKVQELDDAAYSIALKKAILGDVMGFFAPSAPSDGQP